MREKSKFWRSLLSLFFIGISFLCFYFPVKTKTSEVTNNCFTETTVTIEKDGAKLFFNYVGLFFLVMSVWVWRKELKINQLGFVGGKDIEPINPVSYSKDPQTGISTISKKNGDLKQIEKKADFEAFKIQELKNDIISYFIENPFSITNVDILSHKYGVTRDTIEYALFELMKENKIRRDTYPGSGKVIFSYSLSIENRAIDDFIQSIDSEIISDNRFLRIKQRFEVGSVVRTRLENYVIVVRGISVFSTKGIDYAVKELLTIEKYINLNPIKLVLIIATNREQNIEIFNQYEGIEGLIFHYYHDKES